MVAWKGTAGQRSQWVLVLLQELRITVCLRLKLLSCVEMFGGGGGDETALCVATYWFCFDSKGRPFGCRELHGQP